MNAQPAASYFASGAALKAKNERAARAGVGADFPKWALQRLDLRGVRTVLDVGCGWGRFEVALAPKLDRAAALTCCDASYGMLQTCRETLTEAHARASLAQADVRKLPFTNAVFDVVLANHMLYELDDVEVAVAELARVLKHRGELLATTYSDDVRVPLLELHQQALQSLNIPVAERARSSFSLENGRDILTTAFARVDVDVLDETKHTLDPDVFVDIYLQTGTYHRVAQDAKVDAAIRAHVAARFRTEVEAMIAREGGIVTTTRWTAFVAREPRR